MFRLGITIIRLGKIVSIFFFHYFDRTAHQQGVEGRDGAKYTLAGLFQRFLTLSSDRKFR